MEEEEETKPSIIIDNGSGFIKFGFSGEWVPTVIPSCVGYPKYITTELGDERGFLIGTEVEAKRSILNLKYPIENGVIDNWDDMEKIWSYIFTYELKVDPCEYNVMLTEAIMNPKVNRVKMAESMFETFNVPGLYIANQGVLSLLNAGKFTGFVVESGESITQFIPIFEGFCLSHANNKINFGGRTLTKFMMLLLTETGQNFSIPVEKEIVKTIKEKACYVALNFEDELKTVEPFDYELPDGKHVVIKDQRIRCTESIFGPSTLYNYDCLNLYLIPSKKGLLDTCYDSIQKCDIDLKKDLYNNIVLSGGNSMFNGFEKRLTEEIKAFAPEPMKKEVKVIAFSERKFAAWSGGSTLSSISAFESEWFTKDQYEEYGASYIHKKFF